LPGCIFLDIITPNNEKDIKMSLLPKQYGKQGWWDDNRFICGVGFVLVIGIMFLLSICIDFVADKTSDSYHAFKNRETINVIKTDKQYRHIYNTEKKYVIPKKEVKEQKVQKEQKESLMYDKYGNLKDPIYNDSLNAAQTYWILALAAVGILCVFAGFFMSIHPIINILIYIFVFIMCFVAWFW
jgi:hypothetical protein